MLLVDTYGSASPANENAFVPPQAHVWDCFSVAQTYAAAFEANEVALSAGLLPEEATSLSLTLAELAGNAVVEAKGSVASLFFSRDGWRLEVSDSGPGLTQAPSLQTLQVQHSSVRVHRKPAGGTIVVVNYQRPASA